ncbi:pituitary tumor-transforming gene 1 protein-interacting protein-like isoform X2 [Hemicordylus capensis]|uniref:pituitary tumor-transforming gene 1 protein-interacting protein-like isoform X2 n=1 Tax=Hemicordylus capensis TaxID=884348 RepID=UPI0023027A91|nr:pituitary tumor-transforming gene 1 protein-interacting protein-like isoform X2 [Hemicordylus capensis]
MDEEAAVQRWRLWALWLPCFFLLWDRPAAGIQSPPPTDLPPPAMPCAAFTGKTCEECLKNTSCLWCATNSTCADYPVGKLFPTSSVCEFPKAYWAVCWVSFEAMIISMGVVAGILLLLIVCCCCLCYFRKKGRLRGRLAEEEESFIRDREEKRMQSLQRKHERKLKHNEIRKKYVCGCLVPRQSP